MFSGYSIKLIITSPRLIDFGLPFDPAELNEVTDCFKSPSIFPSILPHFKRKIMGGGGHTPRDIMITLTL